MKTKIISTIIFIILFIGCVSIQNRKSNIERCTKDLIILDVKPTDAVDICETIYNPD